MAPAHGCPGARSMGGSWAASLLLQDLHRRLDQARYAPPLEGAAFHYGFNSDYLQKVVAYWRNQFDWRKQVEILNKYPHFHTTIEGEGVIVSQAGPRGSLVQHRVLLWQMLAALTLLLPVVHEELLEAQP